MTFTNYLRLIMVLLPLWLVPMATQSAPGDITTVAGIADVTSPYFAGLNNPSAVAVDSVGNLYIADLFNNRIRKIASDGSISTIAGTGVAGFSGDNGPATLAELYYPQGLSVDGAGNLYIADRGNHRIRKVAIDGIISTVVGTGTAGYAGDNAAAVWAQLNSPHGVSVDNIGNIYIADTNNFRIRKVASDGTISTIAGTGIQGSSGDNGPAVSAQLAYPQGVSIDGAGNLYIADSANHRIRKVASDGIITTVVGTGVKGSVGYEGPATAVQLNYPTAVITDRRGSLYIADSRNFIVRKVVNGIIATVVGTGASGYSGDDGPAMAAHLGPVGGIYIDNTDNLYIADQSNHRIRKVNTNDTITTVAGAYGGFSGDNAPSTSAQLHFPHGVSVENVGTLYIADRLNQRIRKVANDGTITTWAGTGVCNSATWAGCASGGTQLATAAQLDASFGLSVDVFGNLHITDENNSRIRTISRNGFIKTTADTETGIENPRGLTVDRIGNVYIADSANHRIRKLKINGSIITVAGTGECEYSGDNGPATEAQLCVPQGLSIDDAGNLYIVDSYNHRLRKVSPDGTIITVAGTGVQGGAGDDGLATLAQLNYPADVAMDSVGNLYIVDHGNHRIRKIALDGIITTVVGTGSPDYSGDNGPAVLAALAHPSGISIDGADNLYIADTYNHRIRKVAGPDSALPTGTIVIENDRAISNTRTVSLTLSCTDDSACVEMQLSNDAIDWQRWATNSQVSWQKNWTLAVGADDVRTVYARFVDSAGKMSAWVSDSILLDTTPPTAPIILTPSNNTITMSNARPMISGTAEADTSITVRNAAGVLGVMVATEGHWRLDAIGTTLNAGEHQFVAIAIDSAGHVSPTSMTVTYTVDETAPEIILLGANPMTIAQGLVFSDPGSIVTDNVDTNLSATRVGTVDAASVGVYELTYSAEDSAGHQATAIIRTVKVVDQSPPDLIVPRNITLVGDAALGGVVIDDPNITAFLNAAQASDNVDAVITLNHNAPALFANGTTTRVTFSATDNAGQTTTVSATVTINDPLATGDNALAPSGTGFTLAQSEFIGLDPAAATTDIDGDGISDSIEVGDPANPYDRDNDGVFDVFEAGAAEGDASVVDGLPVASGTVRITSPNETLSQVAVTPPGSGAPAGLIFPFGVIAYNTTVAVAGDSKTVRLTFSHALPTDLKLFKVDHKGVYTALEAHWQQRDNNSIEITLTDGDPTTDLDGKANGIIVDPIALADASKSSSSPTSGGGGALHPGLLVLMVLLMRFARGGSRNNWKKKDYQRRICDVVLHHKCIDFLEVKTWPEQASQFHHLTMNGYSRKL